MTTWLDDLLPCTRAMFERLRSQDPTYGSQGHQRDWIDRMDLLQRMFPCPTDHEHGCGTKVTDGKIVYGCYTKQQDEEVSRVIAGKARR